MSASIISVAHVPGFFLKLSLDREPAFIRTCARRWLAHGSITNAQTQPATQSVALSSRDGRLLTARIERTRTQRALLAVSAFAKRGHAWFCNLCRPQPSTAGKCFSFLTSLLKHRQEPSRVQPILFRPNYREVLSLLAAVHGVNLAAEPRSVRQ